MLFLFTFNSTTNEAHWNEKNATTITTKLVEYAFQDLSTGRGKGARITTCACMNSYEDINLHVKSFSSFKIIQWSGVIETSAFLSTEIIWKSWRELVETGVNAWYDNDVILYS